MRPSATSGTSRAIGPRSGDLPRGAITCVGGDLPSPARSENRFDPEVCRGPSPLLAPPATPAAQKVAVVRFESADEVARAVASRIASRIRTNNALGRPTVLGLATGSTPLGVYRELIRMHREEGLDFSRVVTFNLDEYWPLSKDDANSYHHYMWQNLFAHVNVDPANVHLPPGDVAREDVEAACAAYEQAIREAGGIDVQLLGSGENAHIGFNEPGSDVRSRTRLVELASRTRERAVNEFGSLDAVPRLAITTGIGTILEAREVILMATGANKAEAMRRSVEGDITADVPASFLQRHANVRFYVDAAAASQLN